MRCSNRSFAIAGLTLAGVMSVAPLASASIKIYSPDIGERLEPGQQYLLEFTVDANSNLDEYNEQIRLLIKRGHGAEWEELEVLDGQSVMAPKEEGYGARPAEYLWTVPADLECAYCQLRLVQVPGRGDYDDDGEMTFAVGTDFQFLAGPPGQEGVGVGSEAPPEETDFGQLPENSDEPGEVPSSVDGMPAGAPIRGGVTIDSKGDEDDEGGQDGLQAGGCSIGSGPTAPLVGSWMGIALAAVFARRRRRRQA